MDLMAERLTQEAFAPYGDVIAVPVRPGRKYTHPASTMRAPARGEPLDGGRRLVVVCPHTPVGGLEVAHGRAFIARPDQGITCRMNTCHRGLTVPDRPGRFAVLMWLDGSSGDEGFVPVTPFTIRLGG
jgi:ureidoglycolate lyase